MDIFRDKTAIVTGGASGIGKGLCEELAKCGARVVVADINVEEARDLMGHESCPRLWQFICHHCLRLSRPHRRSFNPRIL